MSKLYKCTCCNKHKQLSEFHIRLSGRQTGQRASPICKPCTSEANKQKYKENPNYYNDQSKARRLANPELYRSFDTKYRNNNLALCRARSNKSSSEYYKRFPEKLAEKRSRYRARRSTGQPASLSLENSAKIRSIYKSCKSISTKTGILHHVDHIVPLAGRDVCGLHVPWNLQVIPAKDNLIKSNKFIEDMI